MKNSRGCLLHAAGSFIGDKFAVWFSTESTFLDYLSEILSQAISPHISSIVANLTIFLTVAAVELLRSAFGQVKLAVGSKLYALRKPFS